MTALHFVPFGPEIDPVKLIKFDAGHGNFYVCGAGGMREVESIFFYGDDHDQMYTYTESGTVPPHDIEITVFGANKRRLGGKPFAIPKDRKSVIEENLAHVFNTRRYYFLNQHVLADEIPSQIEFTWKVA